MVAAKKHVPIVKKRTFNPTRESPTSLTSTDDNDDIIDENFLRLYRNTTSPPR